MRAIGVLVVALVFSVAIPSQTAASDVTGWTAVESEFVAGINELRTSRGLEPLQVHDNLRSKARAWAGTMAGEGRIWHSNLPEGITADWDTLGENVGVGPSVGSLHDAFIASPSHFENLVRPDFDYIGIGVVMVGTTIYVAEEFMTLRATSTPVLTATPVSAESPPPALQSSDMERALDRLHADAAAAAAPGPDSGDAPGQLGAVLRRLRALDG